MITEFLPNGCRLVYQLSFIHDSQIYVHDRSGKTIYVHHFNTDQYALAQCCLESLRTLAQPADDAQMPQEIDMRAQDRRVA